MSTTSWRTVKIVGLRFLLLFAVATWLSVVVAALATDDSKDCSKVLGNACISFLTTNG